MTAFTLNHIKKLYSVGEILALYQTGNYNAELLLQHCIVHFTAQNPSMDIRNSIKESEEDITNISNLMDIEINKIEEEIKEGSEIQPIQELNATKEEWLVNIEHAKTHFKQIYEDSKKFWDESVDKTWHIEPKENKILVDDEIVNIASGFMLGPVGLFRNKAVEAVSQQFDNIHEMRTFLWIQSKTKDMVLYMCFEQDGKCFFRGNFVDKR